jgi:hypothetical protein
VAAQNDRQKPSQTASAESKRRFAEFDSKVDSSNSQQLGNCPIDSILQPQGGKFTPTGSQAVPVFPPSEPRQAVPVFPPVSPLHLRVNQPAREVDVYPLLLEVIVTSVHGHVCLSRMSCANSSQGKVASSPNVATAACCIATDSPFHSGSIKPESLRIPCFGICKTTM